MFGSKSSVYDRALEKATSQLLLEPDWDSILQICDAIRQGDVTGKYAVSSIRKKIANDNPHVALYALQVLESVVKNCGSDIHDEIATKEFMEFFKETTQKKTEPVKGKMCELIQVWSHAFRNETSYKIIPDMYNLMRNEGYQFPTLRESDAMFMAEKAPEWKDGESCHRCRTAFTTFNRKHHCRNCGQVFCSKCSSKSSIIPRFGIEREVRVCDSCFDNLNKPVSGAGGKEDELPSEYLQSPLSKQKQTPAEKTEAEIREEEELQLALAISQSEAEAKEKEKKRLTTNYGLYGSANPPSSKPAETAPPPAAVAPSLDTSEMDPELARYLNRNYWQNKAEDTKPSTTQPSAPVAASEPKMSAPPTTKVDEKYQNGEAEQPVEAVDNTEFLSALQGSIQIFVNRMKSDHSRGRSIANDSAVQGLFMTISQMHPQLLKCVHEQEELRTHYENLQDKLAKLKDAREALDALREEHSEKKRREQEEANRIRQIQMAQKLEVLRQKKLEYLEFQRQQHLQRMQQQEQEMRMRLEQERSMVHQRTMAYNPYVQGYNQQTGSAEGSPMHMMHAPYGAPQPGMAAPPGAPGAHMQPGMQMHPQMVPGHPPGAMGAPGEMGPPTSMGAPMGGPQTTMGGPQPSMGGPVPSMGGPDPSMGGPQVTMGGPHPSMGGPQASMGGPPTSMGVPVTSMGGPVSMPSQMGVGGPPQNMGGPPSMGGPPPQSMPPQGMGGPPTTQPMYGQVPPPGQASMPPPGNQGYQPAGPPGGYGPQGVGYHPGQPYPAVTTSQQGFNPGQQPGDPMSMQSLAGQQQMGLPNQAPPQGGPPPPQQYMGGPPQQQYIPPGAQGPPPPQNQQVPEAPGQPEAQLISFD